MSWDFLIAHSQLMLEVAGILIAIFVFILVGGLLLARFDKIPLHDAVYFAFITAMTVGFGDLMPKSWGARVVAVVLAFIGLLLFGVLVAVAVHALEAVIGSG